MGVFLGYPLCDVVGFIQNGGDGFVLSGYWKVYKNATEVQKLFEKFDIVKDDMVRMVFKGYSLKDIVNTYAKPVVSLAV